MAHNNNDCTASQLAERIYKEHGIWYEPRTYRIWHSRHPKFPRATMAGERTLLFPYRAVVRWMKQTGRLSGERLH